MSITLEQFDEETSRMLSGSGSAANGIIFDRGMKRAHLAEKLARAENAKEALDQNTAFQQAYTRTIGKFLYKRAENAREALDQNTAFQQAYAHSLEKLRHEQKTACNQAQSRAHDIAWRIGAFAAGVCVALLITRLSL